MLVCVIDAVFHPLRPWSYLSGPSFIPYYISRTLPPVIRPHRSISSSSLLHSTPLLTLSSSLFPPHSPLSASFFVPFFLPIHETKKATNPTLSPSSLLPLSFRSTYLPTFAFHLHALPSSYTTSKATSSACSRRTTSCEKSSRTCLRIIGCRAFWIRGRGGGRFWGGELCLSLRNSRKSRTD